jgi:hypothetical protein
MKNVKKEVTFFRVFSVSDPREKHKLAFSKSSFYSCDAGLSRAFLSQVP